MLTNLIDLADNLTRPEVIIHKMTATDAESGIKVYSGKASSIYTGIVAFHSS